MTRLLTTGAGIAVLLLSLRSPGRAPESISVEGPPPASVEQSTSPIERSYERPARVVPDRTRLFPWLKEQLKDAPPFFRDTQLDINLRSFYLNNGNLNGTRNEAWAGGGSLSYESGWLLDRLSVGAVLYTSQPLYAPTDRDGTLLLEERQNGYTVLGQLYARVKVLDELFLNLYRYTYNTPYISEHDNRMTPNTFEGYTLQGRLGGADGGPSLRYGSGYITKIKQRDDDEFIWMSRAAGASVNHGVGLAGALSPTVGSRSAESTTTPRTSSASPTARPNSRRRCPAALAISSRPSTPTSGAWVAISSPGPRSRPTSSESRPG